MSHATRNTKLAAAVSSAALMLGGLAPAASAHYGSVGNLTEAGHTVPARNIPPRSLETGSTPLRSTSAQDSHGSPWIYVGVGGALLSGGMIFTAARRRSRHVRGTEPPAATA